MKARNRNKHCMAVIALCIMIAIFTGCSNTAVNDNEITSEVDGKNVVAEFNGEKITQDDIQESLDFMAAVYNISEDSQNWDTMRYSTIQAYLNDKIYNLKAKELGIEVSDEELKAEIDYAATQYGGEKAYEEYISSLNITREFVEDQLKAQIIYNKLFEKVTEDVVVNEDEVKLYYEDHPEEFITKETRDVYGIAFDTQAEAEEALEYLKSGKADFKKLANEKSLDNKNGNGFLGSVSPGDLIDKFDTVVFSLESDQYSDSVLPLEIELENGGVDTYFYVIKATNFVPEKIRSFDSVKKELTDTLLKAKRQEKYDLELKSWKDEYICNIY